MWSILKSETVVILLIILLAAIPRLFYLSQIERTHPSFYNLPKATDPETFHWWANLLMKGEIKGNDKLLYTSFLSIIYRVAKNDLYAARLAQVIIGLFIPVILYFSGKILFGRRVGIIAALISALYAPFIFYEGTLLITTLQLFLMSLLILFLALSVSHLRVLYWGLSGFIVGLMGHSQDDPEHFLRH